MSRLLVLLLVFLGVAAARADQLDLCARVRPLLHDGDVIYRGGDAPWAIAIAQAAGGWSSHNGIVMHETDGSWSVYEAVFPETRKSALCAFFHDDSHRIEVKRVHGGLKPVAVARMKQVLVASIGSDYDIGFDLDEAGTQFCSKLVYNAYLAAIGFGPGHVQTFRDLLARRPNADLDFWNTWFLGDIPWARRTITPQNQVDDARFSTVFSARLPDRE